MSQEIVSEHRLLTSSHVPGYRLLEMQHSDEPFARLQGDRVTLILGSDRDRDKINSIRVNKLISFA